MLKIHIVIKHITNKVNDIYEIFRIKRIIKVKKINVDKYFDTEGLYMSNSLRSPSSSPFSSTNRLTPLPAETCYPPRCADVEWPCPRSTAERSIEEPAAMFGVLQLAVFFLWTTDCLNRKLTGDLALTHCWGADCWFALWPLSIWLAMNEPMIQLRGRVVGGDCCFRPVTRVGDCESMLETWKQRKEFCCQKDEPRWYS